MRKGKPHLAKFVAVLVYMPRPIQIMHPLCGALGQAVGSGMLVRGEEGRDEGGEEGSGEGGECRVKALGDRCLGQRKRWEGGTSTCTGVDNHVQTHAMNSVIQWRGLR